MKRVNKIGLIQELTNLLNQFKLLLTSSILPHLVAIQPCLTASLIKDHFQGFSVDSIFDICMLVSIPRSPVL